MDIRGFFRILGSFVIIILLQIMLLNNINISSLGITPMFYVLAILVMPFEVDGWLQLILAFVLGMSVDIFSDTLGINAAASVLAAFIRPTVLRSLAPRDGYESGTAPYVSYMGLNWFVKYSLLIIFVHHILFFILNAFSFENFSQTILRIIFTTLLSFAFIVLSQFIAFRKQ